MRFATAFVLAGVVAGGVPASAQTPDTDQVVAIERGGRIDINQCRGVVVIRTWDRDEVRVRASHGRRTTVGVRTQGQVIVLGPSSGRPATIDYDITAPEWAGIRLEGVSCAADVEGLSGPVSVDTVESSIRLAGLSGSVDVTTVDGDVTVGGGRGALHLHSVDGAIRVTGAAGAVTASTVDGDIELIDMRVDSVEASSVDGNIRFSGALSSSGRLALTTHDGDVELEIPASTSATIGVRTFERQSVESDLPLTLAPTSVGGRRQLFTIGGGSAQVELETFDGRIRIRRLDD